MTPTPPSGRRLTNLLEPFSDARGLEWTSLQDSTPASIIMLQVTDWNALESCKPIAFTQYVFLRLDHNTQGVQLPDAANSGRHALSSFAPHCVEFLLLAYCSCSVCSWPGKLLLSTSRSFTGRLNVEMILTLLIFQQRSKHNPGSEYEV